MNMLISGSPERLEVISLMWQLKSSGDEAQWRLAAVYSGCEGLVTQTFVDSIFHICRWPKNTNLQSVMVKCNCIYFSLCNCASDSLPPQCGHTTVSRGPRWLAGWLTVQSVNSWPGDLVWLGCHPHTHRTDTAEEPRLWHPSPLLSTWLWFASRSVAAVLTSSVFSSFSFL